MVQNRIGIKDNPGSSSLESATVIIFRTTLTPTIIIIVHAYEATPGFKSTPQMMYKGQNIFGRLSTVSEIEENFFRNLMICIHVKLLGI